MQGGDLLGDGRAAMSLFPSSWVCPSFSYCMPFPLLPNSCGKGRPEALGAPRLGVQWGQMRSAVGYGRCLTWPSLSLANRGGSLLESASPGLTHREDHAPLGHPPLLTHSPSSDLQADLGGPGRMPVCPSAGAQRLRRGQALPEKGLLCFPRTVE